MFIGRFPDGFVDAHPVSNHRDFSKGNASLHHAKGSRIHSEKDDSFPAGPEAFQILRVGFPRIIERSVDLVHGRAEFEVRQILYQSLGRGDQLAHPVSWGIAMRSAAGVARPVDR